MIRLTTKQVISLHRSLIEATGGTDGVRDMGLLESALEAPFRHSTGKTFILHLFRKPHGSDTRLFQITRLLTAIKELAFIQCSFFLPQTELKLSVRKKN